jgi:hypothetical protein
MKPNVRARVTGIEIAISSAERHSQNPISETKITSPIASSKLRLNRPIFSRTCRR